MSTFSEAAIKKLRRYVVFVMGTKEEERAALVDTAAFLEEKAADLVEETAIVIAESAADIDNPEGPGQGREGVVDALVLLATTNTKLKIRILADRDMASRWISMTNFIRSQGLLNSTLKIAAGRMMHNKFTVVDKTTVIPGSANLSVNAVLSNHETSFVLIGRGVGDRFGAVFAKLWRPGSKVPFPEDVAPRKTWALERVSRSKKPAKRPQQTATKPSNGVSVNPLITRKSLEQSTHSTPSTKRTSTMAKKKTGTRKMRQEDEDDFDDGASMASIETGRTNMSDDADFYDSYTKSDGEDAAVDEAIEELTEKRTTTRVAALEKLSGHLSQYLPPDSITDSFVSNVLSCLRKPSEDEALHGARILAMMALIQGGDEERFFQRASTMLSPLAKTSRSPAVKAAAMQALALTCFVCSVEDENTESLLVLFEKYFDLKIVGSICSVALQSWGLLASSLSDEELAGDEYVDRCLPRFLELLTHVDVDVRSAAGENIALLYEAAQKCGMTLPYDEDIIEKFRVMSKDSSKKNSKKDRKVQRLVFRDVHSTLAHGESPQVSFSVKNEMLDVKSWRSIMQLEAIKNAIRTGFQEHIKYNNVVRSILDLPETLEERIIDRREIFDKKSSSRKQKSNELKGDRRRKQHMQDAFFEE